MQSKRNWRELQDMLHPERKMERQIGQGCGCVLAIAFWLGILALAVLIIKVIWK